MYIRASYEDGETEVSLVASKARVSPIKKQTIPRLELLGATILARLMDTIISTLKFTNLRAFYWTDSYTTLCWIGNNRQWKQYGQHRVTEIRQLSNKENCNFCPGSENRADKPSRGCNGQTLVTDNILWTGLAFLYKQQSEWPRLPTTFSSDSALEELVKNPINITHSLGVKAEDHSGPVNLEEILDIQRYGSKHRLLRLTALVIKFTQRLKESQTTKSINAQDMQHAEQLWLKTVQLHPFPPELEHLRDHGKSITYVKQFRLYLDQHGLIRCQSRIGDSNVCEHSKRPYLLPSKQYFTKLIIQDAHHNVHHNGIRETLNLIRELYWIIRGREAIKKIVRQCIVCCKLQGHPYSTRPIPDLPADRVSLDPPFTNTGLDFAGPLHTSDLGENSKTYVCLFTCASTRAVHFELTRDLSVPSFLLAFRRFLSRRGLPSRLLSDNAKTFKCAKSFINKILRSEEISNYFVNKQVIWDTIIEKAPWWGQYWERLVGSLKRCLKKTIGRSTLKFDELRTLLVEIETTLNNRPLTYVYDDQNGVPYFICSNASRDSSPVYTWPR
ncbi:hypothetical protein SNE40_003459 [Patella caerulea]|uniref:Integrase catalytic domain-containing protein n=1 Tax=Patella caerulea TaxID=87958 RepID=A0AAN8KEA5_PATCE